MSKIDKMILKMAEELGDSGGFEPETIDYIASELQISYEEVSEVFEKENA